VQYVGGDFMKLVIFTFVRTLSVFVFVAFCQFAIDSVMSTVFFCLTTDPKNRAEKLDDEAATIEVEDCQVEIETESIGLFGVKCLFVVISGTRCYQLLIVVLRKSETGLARKCRARRQPLTAKKFVRSQDSITESLLNSNKVPGS
jgi:hypothetical protein